MIIVLDDETCDQLLRLQAASGHLTPEATAAWAIRAMDDHYVRIAKANAADVTPPSSEDRGGAEPMTGAELAAKYGFKPHGLDPMRAWVGEALNQLRNRLRSGDEPDSALIRQAMSELDALEDPRPGHPRRNRE